MKCVYLRVRKKSKEKIQENPKGLTQDDATTQVID